jgi:hypothetical protein
MFEYKFVVHFSGNGLNNLCTMLLTAQTPSHKNNLFEVYVTALTSIDLTLFPYFRAIL